MSISNLVSRNPKQISVQYSCMFCDEHLTALNIITIIIKTLTFKTLGKTIKAINFFILIVQNNFFKRMRTKMGI